MFFSQLLKNDELIATCGWNRDSIVDYKLEPIFAWITKSPSISSSWHTTSSLDNIIFFFKQETSSKLSQWLLHSKSIEAMSNQQYLILLEDVLFQGYRTAKCLYIYQSCLDATHPNIVQSENKWPINVIGNLPVIPMTMLT